MLVIFFRFINEAAIDMRKTERKVTKDVLAGKEFSQQKVKLILEILTPENSSKVIASM